MKKRMNATAATILAMWIVAGGLAIGGEAISRSPVYGRPKYARSADVEKECPALTLREGLHMDKWGRRSLAERLSFRNGDWEQAEPGAGPVIPFLQLNDSALPAKLQLSSFFVTDVSARRGGLDDRVRQVKGMLELLIIDGNSRRRPPFPTDARFEMTRGFSALSIEVEGVYRQATEADAVCLLGCTYLPSPDGGINFSNMQNSTGTRALDRQCSIVVQLSYPLGYNLTSRVVRGTIRSLLDQKEDYHFSPIDLSSQVSGGFYKYAAEDLAAKACAVGAPPAAGLAYRPALGDLCVMNRAYLSGGSLLDIEPTWKCNGTAQYCRKIGPFSTYEKHSSLRVDYNSSRAQILVQSFRNPCTFGNATMPIAFVLRLVPADEAVALARERSALDGQTLVAEGYWANRSEFTCMVGCKVDDASGRADICTARVDLFMPLSLSITQRDVFRGRISSVLPATDPDSFSPLAFHSRLRYHRNLPVEFGSALRYEYSRLDSAGAVLSRNEPETRRHKTSWLTYPTLIGEAKGHYQSLADDLSFHMRLKSSKENGGPAYSYMNFDVVAIDSYLPFVWSGFVGATGAPPVDDTIVNQTNSKWTHRLPEARAYLNCSGTMDLSGTAGNDSFSLTIFTEGYYSPKNGKLYMVGCRTVKASWQVMGESAYDLNRGMDCEIEVVFEYPNTLAAWLSNPGVKVAVHSNRPVDDLFHFADVAAETYPILYRRQRENFVSRKSLEGALSILTLSLMLACIVGQLSHIGSHADSAPYVSLLMLGAQAMGYVIPLVTGAGSVLARKLDSKRDYFLEETGYTRAVLYLDKVLTLVALLVLLRIFEKVWKSRSLLAEENPSSAAAPDERKVAAIFCVVHAVGLVSVMALRYRSEFSGAVQDDAWAGDEVSPTKLLPSNRTMVLAGPAWQVCQEYAGLIEDLFLLPQAIAFSLWEVAGQPIRHSFFVGLTLLQIVPHVYDYVRETGFDIHGYPVFANPSFDFYSNVGNILIPALALFLAVLVYCQQRWKGFLKLSTGFLYQRLGSKANEMELVTPNGRKQLPPIPEGDE